MTIAVDLGRKATKQTNKQDLILIVKSDIVIIVMNIDKKWIQGYRWACSSKLTSQPQLMLISLTSYFLNFNVSLLVMNGSFIYEFSLQSIKAMQSNITFPGNSWSPLVYTLIIFFFNFMKTNMIRITAVICIAATTYSPCDCNYACYKTFHAQLNWAWNFNSS